MARTYRLGRTRRSWNTIVTALLRAGVGARSTYLLTTTGARTGLARSTPVVLVEDDGARWLVSPYGAVGWVHNVRADPTVTLRRGRTALSLHATEVDALVAGPILQRCVRQARITAPYFDAAADAPVARFIAEAGRHPVFSLA